jgi:hypothetical protein
MGFVLPSLIVVAVAAKTVASASGTCNARAVRFWALAVCSIITLTGGCHDGFDTHSFKSNPTNRISIVGTIPAELAIELTADWQATVVDDACAPKMGWPVGGRFPKHFSTAIKLESRNAGQATWVTWWDAVEPGRCSWQLIGINFRADRSATHFATHARSIAPSRIAFTCAAGCTGPYPRANDNESDPVEQYCKFSLLNGFDGTINPCAFSSDGTIAGAPTVNVKEQHILRPGQHLVRFFLTDLEEGRQRGFTPAVLQGGSQSGLAPNNRSRGP